MKNIKKIFFILVLASFLFLFFANFTLAQETEVIYPQVPGAETPTTVKTFLPKYIQYIFNLALIIAGLIAFLSLVYGGFRYLASAGNPTTMSDARSQITAGILGLVILIASYLILIQINPELIVLKIGKIEFEKGVILYADRLGMSAIDICNDEEGNPQGEDGKDFLRVRGTISSLGDPALGGFSNQARAVYFYNSSDELEVKIFSQEHYGPEPAGENPVWDSEDEAPFPPPVCFSILPQSQSIQLIWKLPGVYLFTDADCKENPKYFVTNISDFGDFHDKARSIKIISRTRIVCGLGELPGCTTFGQCTALNGGPTPECQKTVPVDKFGAVLYEDNNYRHDVEVFFGGERDEWPPVCIALDNEAIFGNGEGEICANNVMFKSYCREAVGKRASAITIFKQRTIIPTEFAGGVTIYEHENLNLDEDGEECGPPGFRFRPLAEPEWIDPGGCSVLRPGNGQSPSKVSSIKIEGNYIAVLFREDGRGEVFRYPGALRLKDRHIGNDEAKYMLVIPVAP